MASIQSMRDLQKKHKGYISQATEVRKKTMFSIGPLSLNIAVGDYKGVPSGRIVQIIGQESSGKSTLALDIIAQYQRSNPEVQALYVDFERSFISAYAVQCGVDLERLWVVRPETTELGFSIVEQAITDAGIRMVVVDSVAAAKPSSEDTKDYDESPKMASNAGLITRFCTRIVPIMDDNDAIVILINQLRMNFSSLSAEKSVPFGGQALRFTTGVTISLARIERKADHITVQAQLRKNKLGAPYTLSEFEIVFGAGINHKLDIIRLATQYEFIKKSGAWFSFGDQKAQGEQNAAEQFDIEALRALIIERSHTTNGLV